VSPEERRARAFRVQAMMEDGEITAAFNDIEAEFTEEWKRSQTCDERENMWRAIKIVSLVRQRLANYASASSDGSMSAIRRV